MSMVNGEIREGGQSNALTLTNSFKEYEKNPEEYEKSLHFNQIFSKFN